MGTPRTRRHGLSAWFGARSVGAKLAAATVLLVAILAVTLQTSLVHYERERVLHAKEAGAEMLVHFFTAGLAAPLAFNDDRGVEEQVRLLAANDDVVYGGVWPLLQDEPNTFAPVMGELNRRGLAVVPPAGMPGSMRMRWSRETLQIEAPVFDPSGKPLGAAVVAFRLDKERAAVAAMEKRVLALALTAATLLTALLLLLARRLIVRPLGELADAARKLEHGDAATITIRGHDEIGRLAKAFRSMSSAMEEREQRIGARNRDLRRILDNAREGFLTTDRHGVLSPERSKILTEWFGAIPATHVFDYMAAAAGDVTAEWFRASWEMLADGIFPLEVVLDQLPRRFSQKGRSFALEYRAIGPEGREDTFESLLIVIRDVTALEERERAEQLQKETLIMFRHVLHGRAQFMDFLAETQRLVNIISLPATDDATLARTLHTLKGNAALFGIDSIAQRCNELETRQAETGARPSDVELETLSLMWASIEQTAAGFDSRSRDIIVEPAELSRVLEEVRDGATAERVLAVLSSWRDEPVRPRLLHLGAHAESLAKRLRKCALDVRVETKVPRLSRERFAKVWAVLPHLVRNAVDHGLETSDERVASGKPERATLCISVADTTQDVIISLQDDGRGVDWEAIRERCLVLGLPSRTHRDLEEALFSSGVSSRSTATETSGRGVGLSAVRHVVRAEGGVVEVESERGRGTAFRIRMPLRAPSQSPLTRSLTSARPRPSHHEGMTS